MCVKELSVESLDSLVRVVVGRKEDNEGGRNRVYQ